MKYKEGVKLCKEKTNESEIIERTIKVIKKTMYVESKGFFTDYYYGIAIYEKGKEIYRPIYPYVRSRKDLVSLEKFVKEYENDLLEFYKLGHNYDFGRFIYGIGSGRKDRMREKWFKLGVVFY
ncbi:hypothetical protein [Streptococcus porcinus]|uniref:Cytoplasmic protein n=1 Tax=Streptococcus porcinus TaxID=1340 RepID=A0A7V9WSF8_STRPO|nr:hypothetical protein [Streptococcus porcinus]MBA2796232.1 hypothetical protein [Streptococcus porcinus]